MKRKKLSCESARKIPIVKALGFLGHLPTRNSEKEAWFLSPLRSETQASFKVSKTLNCWYDHGLGKGGNCIDLVCELSKVSVSGALEILAQVNTANDKLSIREQNNSKESGIEIKKVQFIQHPALVQYLNKRKISRTIANIFCREVHYTIKDKYGFSIGLKNKSAGWELRNTYFKSSSSPKDLTWIKNESQHLIVLEGMFDLLSLNTIYPNLKREADFLILNSIAFTNKALPYFDLYDVIQLYLDRDEAGRKTTAFFLNSTSKCIDKSEFYSAEKDLNVWLMKRK
ncbi:MULTISPECIES: toprim domain-containing protein [unclassified Leeuwenhoekiella]|uniref:toprim domain-containing protein n=1 Tax=unclassified Leeuwenhoekiella TaxID=2615029 RepID=UPI000C5BA945|nr:MULTISPECIES: toprim domain-containing protein [unclassified Leeuwenhoekiella]MAW96452.1 DNA primase [Leeuwenhoekiella sp.]MBA81339.1 DNA primase [Leeuwenhoekiella sp.]|tara:strand:- start:20952 stop:21806 length:855 start_codon:yes stop_codon:yes gene_type:complete